jgi:hypothetical protein
MGVGPRTQCYERARNRWSEASCRDVTLEEIIKLKAESRVYIEGKGQGVHYLNSLKNELADKKDKKILESFLGTGVKGGHSFRESLSGARKDKNDWEEF